MENVIIIGSGCAGMGAAIYAARAGANPLVIEGAQPGGLLTTTDSVENFPAFPDGISGFDLLDNMRRQAQKFGARIESAAVAKVDFSGEIKKILCESGKVLEARNVIIATGASPRLTGAKGEAQLYGGKGVSTCATCDGMFYRNKNVVVIGGGDSACGEALFLSRICAGVKIIHRRDSFRASQIMSERVLADKKIVPVWDSVVEEFVAGENGRCSAVLVKNLKTGATEKIPCDGAFVAIGHKPNTEIFAGQIGLDPDGYVALQSGSAVRTSVAGVYAAGDCADRKYRQAITAAAFGAMAAIEACE